MKSLTIEYMPYEGWRVEWVDDLGHEHTQEFLLFSEASQLVEGEIL